MTSATDHFSAFVDALTRSLDDPDQDSWSDGDALARRLHLSRFHLDRIVRTVPSKAFFHSPHVSTNRRLVGPEVYLLDQKEERINSDPGLA